MAETISIRALQELPDGIWEVATCTTSTREVYKIRIPSTHLDTERVTWILEDYPMHLPFESTKAVAIRNDLKTYALVLVNQLRLHSFIPQHVVPSKRTIVTVEIYEQGPESKFNSIYWEVLEVLACDDPRFNHVQLLVRRVIENSPPLEVDYDRRTPQVYPFVAQPIKRSYNILLVVSRPRREDDIDPLLGANALHAVIAEVRKRLGTDMVRLEIARPGTWKALQSYLRGRTEQWWRAGGRGAWFDLVHFDVHGRVHEGCGYLDFVPTSAVQKGPLVRSGQAIAEELRQSYVDTVVLHACESAKVTGSPRSNLASALVRSGMSCVIAMSFKLTATAAYMFLRAFYLSLFLSEDKPNMLEALHTARLVLRDHPNRLAKLDRQVRISDYIVPVMYSVASKTESLWKQSVIKKEVPLPPLTAREVAQFAIEDQSNAIFSAVPGRNHDILKIEWLLLREGHSNLLLIQGAPGIGKTSLLNALAEWWKETQLIEHVKYWTLGTIRPKKVIRYLRAWHFTQPIDTTRKPCLFVIDQLEKATSPNVPPAEKLSEEEKVELSHASEQFSDRRDTVILMSRNAEPWFQAHGQTYLLEGLSSTRCISFASKIMREIGWGHFLEEKLTIPCLEYLAFRLGYSPSMINFFLRCAQQISYYNFGSRTLKQKLLIPDTPSNLVFYLHVGFVPSWPSMSVAEECTQRVTSLYENGVAKQKLIMLMLSPLSYIYCEDWYSFAVTLLVASRTFSSTIPTADECIQFVQLHIMDTGWADLVKTSRTRDVGTRFIRLHPAYTNALRQLHLRNTQDKIIFLQMAWLELETSWATKLSDFVQWPENKAEVQLRATSLFAACCLCYDLMTNSDCQVTQPCRTYFFLHLLMFAAAASNTPAVPRDLIYLRSEQLFSFAEQRLENGYHDLDIRSGIVESERLNNVDVVVLLCETLSTQYRPKAPDKATEVVRRMARLLTHPITRGADFNKGSRRHAISKSLINLGHCCLTQSNFLAAKQVASLALHCYRAKNSRAAQIQDALRRIQAYFILQMASAELGQHPDVCDWYSKHGLAAVSEVKASSQEFDLNGVQPELALLKSMGFLQFDPPQGLIQAADTKKSTDQRHINGADLEVKKAAYINAIAEARLSGNVAVEAACYSELAHLTINEKQWDTAGRYIKQFMRLETSEAASGYGVWSLRSYYDRAPAREKFFQYAHYGSVFLRLDIFSSALSCFLTAFRAFKLAGDKWPVTPIHFIGWAMTLIRGNLCLLVSARATVISPREFAELDDRAQQLLMQDVRLRWPKFEMLTDDTAQRLQRDFSWLRAPDIEGHEQPEGPYPSTGAGPGETIGLEFAILCLGSEENYHNGARWGPSEVSEKIDEQAAEVTWDVDLAALAGVLGCRSDIIDANNPR